MTLSVAGILKEVLTVILASVIFDDRLTPVNITGLCIAIGGIAAYNYIKYRSLKRKEQREEQGLREEDGEEEEGQGKGYSRVAMNDEAEAEGRPLFVAPPTPSVAKGSHPLADSDPVEEERRRKGREEEASMDGWESSGECAQAADAGATSPSSSPLLTDASLAHCPYTGFQLSSDGFYDAVEGEAMASGGARGKA